MGKRRTNRWSARCGIVYGVTLSLLLLFTSSAPAHPDGFIGMRSGLGNFLGVAV